MTRQVSLLLAVVCMLAVPVARPASLSAGSGDPRKGFLLVANQGSGDATLIDLATDTSTSLPVGAGPHEAVIAPSGRIGVVTIYGAQQPGNGLAIVDLARGVVTRTISLGTYTRPHGAWFVPGDESRVLVTSESTRNLIVVNIERGEVEAAIPTGADISHMVAVTADGARAFTANAKSGSVSEIDLRARSLVRVIDVAPATEGIAVTPDGREVWAGSNATGIVSIIDTATGTIVGTVGNLGVPYRLAMSPDGTLAAVCDPKGNRLHLIDVKSRAVMWSLDGLAAPRGVHVAPDGRTAFVTLAGDSTVAIVDLQSRTVLRKVGVGKAPDGVWYGRR
jgi:YVTN family beta-propeller protein